MTHVSTCSNFAARPLDFPPCERIQGIRIAFTTRWMGDDVVWAPTIYTRTNMVKAPERLKPGDPPPDDEFPVIWPRAAA
jgi:hypothetical protein